VLKKNQKDEMQGLKEPIIQLKNIKNKSIFQSSKNKKYSQKIHNHRTSFYKKNNEFNKKSRLTCDRDFHKYKDLSSISFFYINSSTKDFYQIKSIGANSTKKNFKDRRTYEDSVEKMGRETGMFPKIQFETNYSFVK
jgi:hypothetical protein